MQHPHNVIIQAAATVINPDSVLLPLSDTNNLSLLKGHKHTLTIILEKFISKKIETVIYIWNQDWWGFFGAISFLDDFSSLYSITLIRDQCSILFVFKW